MNGLEAIQKILDDVGTLTATMNELRESVKLIEASVKVLNNRAAGLMGQQVMGGDNAVVRIKPENKSGPVLQADAPKNEFVPVKASEIAQKLTPAGDWENIRPPGSDDESDFEPGSIRPYKKVFGKLVNNAKEPISGVLIKIYDKNDEVIASAETDVIGYWESMVKEGRYVAEYAKSGFKKVNKTFEIDKSIKELEIK